MNVGFTGTRKGMTEAQKTAFRQIVSGFRIDEFHHGDAEGADREAQAILEDTLLLQKPTYHIHPCDLVPELDLPRTWDVIYKRKPPLDRNKDIVDAADLMIATPATAEEDLRSGTWATIRYARKQNMYMRIILPDGTIEKSGEPVHRLIIRLSTKAYVDMEALKKKTGDQTYHALFRRVFGVFQYFWDSEEKGKEIILKGNHFFEKDLEVTLKT